MDVWSVVCWVACLVASMAVRKVVVKVFWTVVSRETWTVAHLVDAKDIDSVALLVELMVASWGMMWVALKESRWAV